MNEGSKNPLSNILCNAKLCQGRSAKCTMRSTPWCVLWWGLWCAPDVVHRALLHLDGVQLGVLHCASVHCVLHHGSVHCVHHNCAPSLHHRGSPDRQRDRGSSLLWKRLKVEMPAVKSRSHCISQPHKPDFGTMVQSRLRRWCCLHMPMH